VAVSSGGAVFLTSLSVSTTGFSVAAGGSATIQSNGAATNVGMFTSCEVGATITYQVTGSFALGTAPTSGIIINYSASSSSQAFGCGVTVIDSVGFSIDVTPATPTRRRLLSTGQGSGQWGTTSLTYQAPTFSSSSSSSTAGTPYIADTGASSAGATASAVTVAAAAVVAVAALL